MNATEAISKIEAGEYVAVIMADKAEFPDGIAGVAPGQSAVFYAADNEDLLCGGVIQ